MFLACQQVVEEVEQQRFRYLLTEDSLETYVGKGVYELCHSYVDKLFFLQK